MKKPIVQFDFPAFCSDDIDWRNVQVGDSDNIDGVRGLQADCAIGFKLLQPAPYLVAIVLGAEDNDAAGSSYLTAEERIPIERAFFVLDDFQSQRQQKHGLASGANGGKHAKLAQAEAALDQPFDWRRGANQ